jgi:hypothetical protein
MSVIKTGTSFTGQCNILRKWVNETLRDFISYFSVEYAIGISIYNLQCLEVKTSILYLIGNLHCIQYSGKCLTGDFSYRGNGCTEDIFYAIFVFLKAFYWVATYDAQ